MSTVVHINALLVLLCTVRIKITDYTYMGVEKQSGRIESIQTVKVLVHANMTISRRTQHSSSVPYYLACEFDEKIHM
jgi:hypothetical protein